MTASGSFYFIKRGMRVLCEQRGAAHLQAWRTQAALHCIVLDEGRLHRMQLVAVAKALDGRHRAIADVNCQHHTGRNWNAVQPHGAYRTRSAVAADLGSSQ